MADKTEECSQEQKDDDKIKKSILEEKSKDELIKLVKKYIGLLQKSKNKIDILNEKCSVLEQEKNSLIQAHKSKEEELKDTIDNLQQTISETKAGEAISENALEIEQLKQKLKESEDKIQNLLLQENEEQLQCLNMQLQTLKASCQCIQEENLKLRKSHKEKAEEISLLVDKNTALLCDLNKKDEEYGLLYSVKENTQAKYEKSVEENHSLQTEVKKLEFEQKKLQKNCEELSSEIQELKLSSKDKDSENNDVGYLLKEIQKYQDENEKLKKEIQAMKNETDNLNVKNASSGLTNETYDFLIKEKFILEENNKTLQKDLDNCQQQIHKLQNEIQNIVTAYQIDDYKMSIELALLQGASSDEIIYPVEPLKSKNEISQFKNSEVKANNAQILKMKPYPYEEILNIEYALLQGGDASKLIVPNTELTNDMYSMFGPCNETVNEVSGLSSNDTATNYQKLLEKYELLCKRYESEKKTLQKNLDEYSSLCHDTMKENDELKQQLDYFQNNKILCHQETCTDPYYFEETDSSKVSADKTSECQVKSCENCKKLCNEIVSVYNGIQDKKEIDSRIEKFNSDHFMLLKKIKNLFDDMHCDLERKKFELNEFNLQLELLVIGVKQGVRQKNSNYQAENKPEENINTLRTFVEDLVSRSSCFDSKLQMIQSETNNKMHEMEDQINQLKELNQFLEEENSALNVEVEKIKSRLNDSVKNFTNYSESNYLQNNELYSIDESSEFDSKIDVNCNNQSDKENINTCDISIQAHTAVQDCAVQVESDFCYEKDNYKVFVDADVQTNFENENCKIIEQLKNDNESFKNIAHEKSELVESIHCQMDSLLVKVEELTIELQNKDDDLKHMKNLNFDLEKMLAEAENLKNLQTNNLKTIQDLILKCKKQNFDLNDDVRSFISSFEEMIVNVQNNILNVINENSKNADINKEMCSHKENNLVIIKNWILELSAEFNYWFSFINQLTLDSTLDLSKIPNNSIENASSNILLSEKAYHEDACCSILESADNFNSYKLKFFSALCNHLSNNYSSIVKEIQNYKMDVIPKMEKKLLECTCNNESKMKVDIENTQKETSEESLKNILTETEIKMNKFKQIAVKLKKELASTKEQLSEVISEKEKLQGKNAELLDELNKITEEQYKCVQNYQTLQNEYDKLQDDCEIHKGNVKKLEDDFALKLNELSSVKEQVENLENELKSSKVLLENNLSVKKNLDSKCADLESKIIILETKINEKEQKLSSKELEIAKFLKDLNLAQEDIKQLKNELELAQKEGNKKSLLDLEMADYERSITELNSKIRKKEDEIEELQHEINSLKEKNDCLHEELKTTESLKETEAKRAESLREILEKTKSEFNEVKEHEAELLSKTASLEVRLESMTQQEEHLKIQLSETSAQIQHFQDVIKTSSDNHQRIVRSLEQKISNQKEEMLAAHKEVESVKQEFENYKIRVHSVLKQQKSVTPGIASVNSDFKEKLETANEKLKLQVKELSEKITAMTLEYDTLQEENSDLLQRYDRLIEDRDKKDKEWQQRLEIINTEKNRLCAAQEELSSQHLLQNEMLVATYKKQIKIMSEEHKKIVNDLQKQLDAADVEISRLQRDQQKLQGLPVTPSPQESATSFDLLSQERQEGEGSENTDEINTPIKHLSLATIPTSGFLPFEKLLQSPVEPGTPASYVSAYDAEKLALDLNTANKKIDHLSELLNDSESTNMRLNEQIRVLKDEVRRLENNKERQQHAENLEYLKNVFVKFATLQPGSEKAMLIPVLTTMLKLNPDEQQQLKSIAGDVQTDDNMNSGWGSYLHRWSGLS